MLLTAPSGLSLKLFSLTRGLGSSGDSCRGEVENGHSVSLRESCSLWKTLKSKKNLIALICQRLEIYILRFPHFPHFEYQARDLINS